jgi:hypothetical protein
MPTEPRLQNVASSFPPALAGSGATSAQFFGWNVPAYGQLKNGGRVEPIAAGGVRGAGLYLNGTNWVRYDIPSDNPSMGSSSWYYGIWVDPSATGSQVLFALSDGSTVTLANPNSIQVIAPGGESAALDIPSGLSVSAARWTHIGLAVLPSRDFTTVKLYLNGYHLGDQSFPGTVLMPAPGGSIYLGGTGSSGSFVGWVDDFKVRSRIPCPEEICREAYGSLVGLDEASDATSYSVAWNYAGSYPASSHAEITSQLPANATTYARYFCEMKVQGSALPTGDGAGGGTFCIDALRATPPNPRCIGTSMVFPEGPIRVGVRRPDSTRNSFCLSCHVDNHPSPSLTPPHLAPSVAPVGTTPGWVDAAGYYLSEADPRRRPLEERQLEVGVVPANQFCPNVPSTPVYHSIFLDRWVNQCE